VISATRLSRSHLAGETLSVRQEVALSLARLLGEIIRLWVTLLDQDRDPEGRGNQGAHYERSKPSSIAIEPSDNVTCQWNPLW
jgi:hypothetical protein